MALINHHSIQGNIYLLQWGGDNFEGKGQRMSGRPEIYLTKFSSLVKHLSLGVQPLSSGLRVWPEDVDAPLLKGAMACYEIGRFTTTTPPPVCDQAAPRWLHPPSANAFLLPDHIQPQQSKPKPSKRAKTQFINNENTNLNPNAALFHPALVGVTSPVIEEYDLPG
ncbi:Uncharacterized protein Fot_29769 [Forsythia ovata]|uniref:Uncharacterized protein n=1 Tax=Forsythia ovata TaxID=205694 RepID=A0ABD1TT95_9LAMI